LQRNKPGNQRETPSFQKAKTGATFTGGTIGNTSAWRNPCQEGASDARKESLKQIMTATWECAWKNVTRSLPLGYEITRGILEA
jgi:hypothetical protein